MKASPPQAIEAEQAILCCCLSGTPESRDALSKLSGMLLPEDFYVRSHMESYRSALELSSIGKTPDTITVVEHLRSKGMLEDIGGTRKVSAIVDEPPVFSMLMEHAELVKEKSIKRHLMEFGYGIYENSMENGKGTLSSEDLLALVSKKMLEIGKRKGTGDIKIIEGIVKSEMSDIVMRSAAIEAGIMEPSGIKTGFAKLDKLTAGMHGGEMFVLAARPGMGKTAFAISVALNAARNQGVNVLFFSIEMSASSVARRLLSIMSGVDSNDIRTARLFKEDQEKLAVASEELARLPIKIDDSPRVSPFELRSKVRQGLGDGEGKKLVIVDYMQLMEMSLARSMPSENRQQEITIISRLTRGIAKEFKVPILILSQLNRNIEGRSDQRPRLSDLRESGSIEQDADVILFLHKPPLEEGDDSNEPIVEITCTLAKQRNGPVGAFPLEFNRPLTKFTDKEEDVDVPTREVAP